MTNKSVSGTSWIVFIGLAIVWGSSFILMKRGLVSFSPVQVGMIRIVLASATLLSVAANSLRKIPRSAIVPLIVVGLFSNLFPYFLFPMAVTRIDSGLVGVLNSLVPLFTLLIGIFVFRITAGWLSIAGILVGLAGAVWLLVPGLNITHDQLAYGMLPVIAGIGYAIGVNTVNRYLDDVGARGITTASLAIAAVPALVILASTKVWTVFTTDTQAWSSLGYIAILAVLGTALANLLFNDLIHKTGSLFSSSVTYAIPVVALMWGFYDGESVGWHEVVGMVLILAGVAMVNMRSRK